MKKYLALFVFVFTFLGITFVQAEEVSISSIDSSTVSSSTVNINIKPENGTIFKTKEVSFAYSVDEITEKTECVYSVDFKEKNKLENCKEGKIVFELENGTHLLYFWASPDTRKEIKFEVAIPVDGGWSAWSEKDNSCGVTGTQTRICTEQTNGGIPCSEIDGGKDSMTYTNEACPSRRGGSSGSYMRPVVATTPNIGEVLGAEKHSFTSMLKYGLRGDEINELHKVLIAGGYLKIPSPTGFFGPLTRQAVKDFQLANNLDGDGIVGPLTREVLNK